jgi:tRNA threonylcarbamoyladenosine biosynthesis protein TsaE
MIASRHLADAGATRDVGRELGREARPGQVIALAGGLGAGKTTLVQGIAEGLGCPEQVSSPTFSLVHELGSGRLPLFHFDFYRIGSADELLAIGWDEYLEAGGLVVAEWADLFPGLMPPDTIWLALDTATGGGRALRRITAPGEGKFP